MEVMAVGGAGGDMEICVSRCSSTTTADDELGGRAWSDFSPVVDWGMFVDDDFHGLVESMMACDGAGASQQDRGGCFPSWDHLQGGLLDAHVATPSNSGVSCGRSADVPMAAAVLAGREGGEEPDMGNEEGEDDEEEEDEEDDEEEEEREDMKGLRLVHLLMAAAEAMSGENGGLDLARVILVRLKEMASPNAASNMERLAACFTDALQALLDAAAAASGSKHSAAQHHHKQLQMLLQQQQHQPLPGDALAAFQLLQDMSPYVKFGHFTANQAILEAVAGERRVHILDYDIMEGVQWASLIQALVSHSDGAPPPPHLRITAVSRGAGAGGAVSYGRRPIGTIQETGRRLAAFAASVGQSFSFAQCRQDADEGFRAAGLKLVKGEALVVNCMLHLPHSAATQRPALSVASFLSGAAALSPRLVTLVEEETGSGAAGGTFVGRFMESLHHYSAVYDSLEAGFPMHARSRALVERVFLGPRIAGTVSRVYNQAASGGSGGDQEPAEISWGEWMGKAGFRKVGISFSNRCQAKLLVGLFNDGYQVEDAAANKLVLAWKSRRLLSASVWTAPSPAPPPPSSSAM